MSDTIFALATAEGKAGVAVVRISGPSACEVLRALGGEPPKPRCSRLIAVRDAEGRILDRALVLYFAEGASFTGENIVELQLHGSVAGVRLVLSAIAGTGLARMAEPGEFTRRALMNDRLDLTQVQGLADLIDADTEAQHRFAMEVFDGGLTGLVEGWRRDLVRAIALLEVTIDFADEEVPEDVYPEVDLLLSRVVKSLQAQLEGVAGAERIRAGFDVAIVGAPNAGKSSLLNYLTRSEAAIVSEIAGTTRDLIEVRLNVGGLQVNLIDTAGLRSSEDEVEKIGVARAIDRANKADLRIFLFEGDAPRELLVAPRAEDVILRSKVDLGGKGPGISTVTGEGIDELLQIVETRVRQSTASAGLVSRTRDRIAIQSAADHLLETIAELDQLDPEIASNMIREAAVSLQAIIGGVDVEAILDEIFTSFCLGK